MAARPLETLLRGLLLRGDGAPRQFAGWAVFRGGTGAPRGWARRLLFRKNGQARGRFDRDLQDFLNAVPLARWIAAHDTPGAGALRRLAQRGEGLPPLPVLIEVDGREDAASLMRMAKALGTCVGRRLDPIPVASATAATMEAVERAFGRPALPLPELDLAPGPVLILLRGALPRAHGPAVLVEALARAPGATIAYGDEADLLPWGGLANPWFKPPSPSPLLASQGGLLGNLVAVDLARAPGLLAEAGRSGFRAALAGLAGGLPADEVRPVSTVVALNTLPALPPLPLALPALPAVLPTVSIIIPTRDGWTFLGPCLASLETTDWPRERLEIIVVDNGSTEAETLAGLAEAEAAGRIRVIRDASPFNYARINNRAAAVAKGSLLVFLNNDTTVRQADWLRRMAALALRPGTGIVGTKLLYADGTVQHAGLVLGMHGGAAHVFVGIGAEAGGYGDLALQTREVSVVTAACVAIAGATFEAVGGFNEDFAVAYNDVVLCADLIAAGRTNYCLAEPLFHHYESKTRGQEHRPDRVARERDEARRAVALHPGLFGADPFYSACLSLDVPYGLAEPPRRVAPWAE